MVSESVESMVKHNATQLAGLRERKLLVDEPTDDARFELFNGL